MAKRAPAEKATCRVVKEGRSCTDIFFLILFILFLAGWIAIGAFGIIYGDPSIILNPTDSFGRKCGVDPAVIDKPYLFYFDFSQCANLNTTKHGCPTPQVCVTGCPTESFKGSNLKFDTQLKDTVCLPNINPKNIKQLRQFINEKKCAEYYLQSTPVALRCLPDISALLSFNEMSSNESLSLKSNIEEGARITFALMETSKEFGHEVVEDLTATWPVIIVGIVIAMVVSLLYIILMRWFAGIMIWFSILGTLGLIGYGIYACYERWTELKNQTVELQKSSKLALFQDAHPPRFLLDLEESFNESLENPNTWLAFLIVLSVLLLLLLLITIFLRKRIVLAVKLIGEASKAVGSTMSTLFFPLVPWILQAAIIGWALVVAVYLYSNSKAVYRMTAENTRAQLRLGDPCELNKDSTECSFYKYTTENYVVYLQVYNGFGLFWFLFWLTAFGEMALSGTFAHWYWHAREGRQPFFALTESIGRALRYHIGTMAFGSLILAICTVIRVFLEYVDHKLKKYDNPFTRGLMCCLKCFFWCLDKFIRFVNRNAYIMCAIRGRNFCGSAREAFSLIARNVIRVFVVDKVTDYLLFMGKFLITAALTAAAYIFFTRYSGKEIIPNGYNLPTLNYIIIPVLCVTLGSYFVANIFFSVYAMAVDTIFLCFLEDCEQNDGSPTKPYAMSKSLMKLLGRSNAKQRKD